MNITFYLPEDNTFHCEVLSSFFDGVKRCGLNPKVGGVQDCIDADIAVIFGVGKKSVPVSYPRGKIFNQRALSGKNTIVLEMGYIKRDEYFAAGWNGLNGRADFLNKEMPSDRWDALGIEFHDLQASGNNVLVCGQVPHDASVQHSNHLDWIANTIKYIRTHTKHTIRFRPHPLAKKITPDFVGAITSTDSLEDDMKWANQVVTYNSNIGVDAIIEGKYVFAEDSGSMVYSICNKDLNKILSPLHASRVEWANNIAYAQWTLEEMKTGLPFLHLTRHFKND